jgi:hypothetical protein
VQIPNLKLVFVLLGLIIIRNCKAQYNIEVLDSSTYTLNKGVVLSKTSFRGLSVVDDNIIWVSGSRGTFARSTDGGKTFTYIQLKDYEKSDFRDIEAFDDKRAVMMSSGNPAYILNTTDGGQTWKEVFKNTDSAYFLDAMDFWDEQRGILVGDPINGHFLLLETNNGGETWVELDTTKTPHAMEGEAVFAASGTSLRCWGKNEFGFVTGGSKSRIIIYSMNQFDEKKSNIQYGMANQGAFSFGRQNTFGFVIVGGDYICDSCVNKNSFIISPETIHNEYKIDVKGYRSCVEIINSKIAIACGTKGSDIYLNKAWNNISSTPFHVVRKAKKGKGVFLAGPKGRIGKLVD